MRVPLKIFLILYYFFLSIFIIFLIISINGTANGIPFFHIKNIAIINNVFYVLLLIIGLLNLGKKHKKWLSKQVVLFVIAIFTLWIIAAYIILFNKGVLENDYTLKVTLAILPCLAHTIWYYFNFKEKTYSFKQIDNTELTSYSQIFDLELPYLKIVENTKERLHIRLSVPYSLSQLFGIIFTLFWMSAWIFGATMLFLEYPLAVFLYIPSIVALYFLSILIFTKIDLIITPF